VGLIIWDKEGKGEPFLPVSLPPKVIGCVIISVCLSVFLFVSHTYSLNGF